MIPDGRTPRCSSWFPPTPSNVRPLPKHEIDAYLKSSDSKKTSGGLYQAYECASHPKQWIAEQEEHRQALASGAAETEDEAAEDEDELAEDGENGEPAGKSGGKRKRATADVKKPTKKETVSKKAKTEKAPAKKVRGLSESPRGICLGSLSLRRDSLPGKMPPKTTRNPFPRRLRLQRLPQTKRLLLLRTRRLLPLHLLQRRPKRPKKPRKMLAMVRAVTDFAPGSLTKDVSQPLPFAIHSAFDQNFSVYRRFGQGSRSFQSPRLASQASACILEQVCAGCGGGCRPV